MSQRYHQLLDDENPANVAPGHLHGNASFLSPHNSVFQLLNNPELGSLEISRSNSRNVCDSPDLSSSHHPHQSFNEFSSWHLVPQGSGSSSYNNLSGPSSILSSSDAEDNQVFINSYIDTQRHSHLPSQRREPVIFCDNGSNSEDEDLIDENDSTVHQIERLQMPSFIMPRVSVTEDEDFDKLKVNVVGEGSSQLVERLSLYNKVLQNVKLNSVNPDLIILIVDQDNLLLSQQISKPFIPIFISTDESSSYEQEFHSTMITSMSKICQPIHLNSLEDDLFLLINLLSNIDSDQFKEQRPSASTLRKNSGSEFNNEDRVKKSRKLRRRDSNNNRNFSNRLINLIYKLINSKLSTVCLSVGSIGLCYYGVSMLLDGNDLIYKEKDSVVPPTQVPIEPVSISEAPTQAKDAGHFQALMRNLEYLIENLVERGRLTGYWLYYNMVVMWD